MKKIPFSQYVYTDNKVIPLLQLVPVIISYIEKNGEEDSGLLGYVPRGTKPEEVFIPQDWLNNPHMKITEIIVLDCLSEILHL